MSLFRRCLWCACGWHIIGAAAARGAGKVILGLGGSATVDGGLGACQALGVRFYRRGHGSRMSRLIAEPVTGNVLSEIDDIDADGIGPEVKDMQILLACDVDAPFTGPSGAACVFGPQKGASPEEVSLLDRGLENVRNIIKRKYGLDLNEVAGSGAAGGCAGGMVSRSVWWPG